MIDTVFGGKIMRIGIVLCALVALHVSGNYKTANAATFTAIAVGGGCEDRNSGSTGVSSTCSDLASANSEPGRLGVYAFSQRSVTSPPLTIFDTGNASSTAILSDRLTFGISEGTFVLPVDLAGTFGSTNLTSSNGGLALLKAELRGGSAGNFFYSGDFSQPDAATFVENATFNFTGGAFNLTAILEATARSCTLGLGENESCTAEVDFSSSLRLLGGTVLDTTGRVVDTTITATSGFDYKAGFEPHNPIIAPVPLPAGMPLLLAGLAGLFAIRKRRSQV